MAESSLKNDFLRKLPLEMKTILSIGTEDKELELDRPTANGGYFVLDLLPATLFDPTTVKGSQSMADEFRSRNQEACTDSDPRMLMKHLA
jgi:hypothetical protein